MQAIETVNLSKSYDGQTRALDDLSLDIPEGTVFSLLGPNGSGKTTTVRLLNGILTPTTGQATLFGLSVRNEVTRIHAMSGVMTETAQSYENLSGDENLFFFGRMHSLSEAEIQKRADRLLDFFTLTSDRHRKVRIYSTGMKRRLLLAIAMLHKPRLLFLDEPTSGLDPEAARKVNDLIRRLAIEEKVTAFLCTHQLRYAQEICDKFGFLSSGRLIACGTMPELQARCHGALTLNVRGEGIPADLAPEPVGEGLWRFRVDGDSEADNLIRRIVSGGGRVFEARQARMNLEDLYFAFQAEARHE